MKVTIHRWVENRKIEDVVLDSEDIISVHFTTSKLDKPECFSIMEDDYGFYAHDPDYGQLVIVPDKAYEVHIRSK